MTLPNKEQPNKLNPDLIHFSAFDIELNQNYKRSQIIDLLQELKASNKQILDLQSFQFNSLLSQRQLLSAVWHAWNGFKNHYSISNLLSIEFLLYVSGQRQISKALEFFGLEQQVEKFSLIVFHENIIKKGDFISFFVQNTMVRDVKDLTLTDTLEKRNKLSKIFGFKLEYKDDLFLSKESFINLENYILTSISNLVFEAKLSKKDE